LLSETLKTQLSKGLGGVCQQKLPGNIFSKQDCIVKTFGAVWESISRV
jgi:hypothetical protein